MADCTGEEREPCLQGILFQETSAGTRGQGTTRWLLLALPEIAELYCVLLCAWRPSVEVIMVADISTERPGYGTWRGESSHLGVSW